jgi:hypothetical protein
MGVWWGLNERYEWEPRTLVTCPFPLSPLLVLITCSIPLPPIDAPTLDFDVPCSTQLST